MQRAPVFVAALVLSITTLLIPPAALADRTDPMGGTGGGPITGSLHVLVIHADTGVPFPGAFVMAGPNQGTPCPGNWGFTSGTGEITLADPLLQGPLSVTAGADGHAYFTIVSVNANDLVLPLREISNTQPVYQVGDYVSGIDVNNGSFHSGDGYVDMAFVMPALKLENIMSFDMANLMGPLETITILGQPYQIPSNVFIPQQWELFVEIIKDHYYLYLNPGAYTLTAMSGRVPRDALLNSSSITDIIPVTEWREIDLRDVTIAGPTNDADLNVDPDLAPTVTLNLANIPEGSVAWCFSLGDLDNQAGLGRLVPMGLNSFSCPGGSGPCGASVTLTTTPATGEFAGMSYFPGVAVDANTTEDVVAILSRAPHPQSYTENFSSFFHLLDLSCDGGHFSWNDVANLPAGSPPVHVSMARIVDTQNPATYWEFMIPGQNHEFEAPRLPAQAPPGPQLGTVYGWDHASTGLGYNLGSFDFNSFAFSDVLAHGSHIASDKTEIEFIPDPAGMADGPSANGSATLSGWPNPFRSQTTLRFQTQVTAPMNLSVYALDGRKVVTLQSRLYTAGDHQVVWRGTDAAGRPLPSGVYMARLSGPGVERSWRMVLQR
jgi:hypothetical protein